MTLRGFDIAIDPVTRQRIRGSLTIEPDGAIEIRLPHRLESPNKLLHAHWRARTADKQAWRTRLEIVIGDAANLDSLAAFTRPLEALGLPPVKDKRILRIVREVPSGRNFIRDDDNLIFSGKALVDQLRRLGFVRDDDRKWTELHVTQRVSSDKRDWTVCRIEIPPGAAVPFSVRR